VAEVELIQSDIKPENLLLHTRAAFPRLLVADFGHAVTLDELKSTVPSSIEAQGKSRSYERVGTCAYLPPERLQAFYRGRKRSLNGLGESSHGQKRRNLVAESWFKEEILIDVWSLGGESACVLPVRSCLEVHESYRLRQ
jgi:serine/threonine protein kinase